MVSVRNVANYKIFLIDCTFHFSLIFNCCKLAKICYSTLKHSLSLKFKCWRLIPMFNFNPFIPNVPFFYPLKTSENRKVFWCFQGIQKGCIGNECVWVKLVSKHVFVDLILQSWPRIHGYYSENVSIRPKTHDIYFYPIILKLRL